MQYRWLPTNSASSNLKTFEEKFLTQQPQTSGMCTKSKRITEHMPFLEG
jgi:hypothetical protein